MTTRVLLILPLLLGLVIAAAPPVDAGGMDDFGRCLTRSGAIFYGASWCPVCRTQSERLGAAMNYVRYVECADRNDSDRSTSECKSANIKSYPTWVFGDRSRKSGGLSLTTLANRSGCALPAGAQTGAPPAGGRAGAPPAGGRAVPPPPPHRPKIIEIR